MKVTGLSRTDLVARLVVTLAPLTASFAHIERAAADCTPAAPVNNAIVTCTGTTTNANAPNGYGTNSDTGNTINVQPGASVTGGSAGVLFEDGTVNNLGTISGVGAGSIGISSLEGVTVVNSGTITGQSFGIFSAQVGNNLSLITNFRTISAGENGVGIDAGPLKLFNSGTITAPGLQLGFGVIARGDATVVNSGTISGGLTGIRFAGLLNNLVNSGTIASLGGVGGKAIEFVTGSADTLTLLPGSKIIGAIDMGGGNDVVNFRSGAGVAQLVTLENFTGTINTSGPGLVFHNATQIATLDPTAFALADRSLLDFTGGISALVQGRLAGADANGWPSAGALAVRYAPDDRKLIGKAPPAASAAPYVVWTEGFGGTRTQKPTDELLRATSTAWGGVIGVDRQVRNDLLLGAFVGGGTSRLAVDQGSQRIDTDHVVGGVYGRFDWVSQFFDFKLQAGGNDNRSTRQVFSNLAPNGLENASAHSGGWFISPELGYGLRYGLGSGYTLTPMARVRYVAGVLDGYSETGSGQGLSVGRRTLQNVEERGEIELARTSQFGLTDTIRTYMHGGVIALQRVGDTTVNTTLIGQSFNFATPGKDSATGAVAGAGFDLTVGGRVSVFGALEGTVMSDKSRTGTAKGGMRVAF
jgi:uncharacterized protein with beta-barrel porin domain